MLTRRHRGAACYHDAARMPVRFVAVDAFMPQTKRQNGEPRRSGEKDGFREGTCNSPDRGL